MAYLQEPAFSLSLFEDLLGIFSLCYLFCFRLKSYEAMAQLKQAECDIQRITCVLSTQTRY